MTPAQQDRVFGLLRSAGDVWSCVLDLNGWRRQRGGRAVAGYQDLCAELTASPGRTWLRLTYQRQLAAGGYRDVVNTGRNAAHPVAVVIPVTVTPGA